MMEACAEETEPFERVIFWAGRDSLLGGLSMDIELPEVFAAAMELCDVAVSMASVVSVLWSRYGLPGAGSWSATGAATGTARRAAGADEAAGGAAVMKGDRIRVSVC